MENFDICGFKSEIKEVDNKRYIRFMFWMAGPKNSKLDKPTNKQEETLDTLLKNMQDKGFDSYKKGKIVDTQ